MATTDSRTGFRLPWSTDRSASREASAEPADSPEANAVEGDLPPDGAAVPQSSTSDQVAPGSAIPGDEEEPVTTLAPDAAPHTAQDGAPAAGLPGAGLQAATDPVVARAPGAVASTTGPSLAPAAAPLRRPTKFLADLTRAMQAAAEQARGATIDQFRADGTSVMEQIHGRSATGATELRHRADEDVAAIKEWSKAEIARIREETERRITSRREQLEGQLERHAALVEHEIEKVRGRIAAFEAEMGRFFDDLLRDEDPSVFAARAASLPEPPSFDDLDDDALTSLMREPGLGVPGSPDPLIGIDVPDEPPAATADASVAQADGAVAAADEAVAVAAVDDAVVAIDEAVMAVDEDADAEATTLDREAAMAAIQAAAEAAASIEACDETGKQTPAVETTAEAVPQPEATGDPHESLVPSESATVAVAEDEPEIDPRLAMLGLTPDFEAAEVAAAEVAAAEAAASELDEVAVIGDEALAARLSGLVPDENQAPPAPTATTQVVVTGLVSVASIASFKRHLGRLAGVGHVGVSSGPDGEFVFSVAHDPATSLRELIPTVPGFGARVVGNADGIVQVSAQDPQD